MDNNSMLKKFLLSGDDDSEDLTPLEMSETHTAEAQMVETQMALPKKWYWGRPKKFGSEENLPMLEAAKVEIPTGSTKTPVSILQELLSRRGTVPKYELVQIEGAIHEPTFRYRVTVADVVAFGTGRSKKEAKHCAAKNILEKLVGNSDSDDSSVQNFSSSITMESEERAIGNPIGSLQEMCISRRWPPPTYEVRGEEGLPHERQFTIACIVYKYREIGVGKSKKLAKRQAAQKMWEKLHDCKLDCPPYEYEQVTHKKQSISNRYADVKNSKIATLTVPHSNKISAFHKNLKQNTGVKLSELQTAYINDDDFNHVQFLQEIATEQEFEVTYVDIEERSHSGKYQCLVQLSTLPVAVCYGSGYDPNEAQANAAHNALEYLKIMTAK